MIVLFVLALSWLAAAVGLLARSVEAANSVTFVLMFLPYVSTAFVPARTMPGRGCAAFAAHQPFTPIVETMRGLWMGHTSTGASVASQAWLAVLYCLAIPDRVGGRRLLAVPAPGQPERLSRGALAPGDSPGASASQFSAADAYRAGALFRCPASWVTRPLS